MENGIITVFIYRSLFFSKNQYDTIVVKNILGNLFMANVAVVGSTIANIEHKEI